jgi:hypothetical protein
VPLRSARQEPPSVDFWLPKVTLGSGRGPKQNLEYLRCIKCLQKTKPLNLCRRHVNRQAVFQEQSQEPHGL